MIEQGLANAVPIAIGFLANQVGLGNIPEKIVELIGRLRELVDKALDWLIGKAVTLGRAALRALGLGPQEEAPPEGDVLTKTVTMHGSSHTIESRPDGALTMASAKGSLLDKALSRLNAIAKHTPAPTPEIDSLQAIISLARDVRNYSKSRRDEVAWGRACDRLIAAISDYGQRFDKNDIDPAEDSGDIAALVAAAVHITPAGYGRKHAKGGTDADRRRNSYEASQFLVSLSDGQIAALERDTLTTGDLVPRGGGAYHAYKTHGQQLGWDAGQPAFVLRAELSAGHIHSHPRQSR